MMGSVAIVLLLLALRARKYESASSFATPGKKWATVSVVIDRYPNILGTQTRELVDAALGHDAAVSRLNVIHFYRSDDAQNTPQFCFGLF